MRPRLLGRGRRSSRTSGLVGMARFNEAPAFGPGKAIRAIEAAMTDEEASMRPRLLGRGRPECRGPADGGAADASMRPRLLGRGRRAAILALHHQNRWSLQ